MSERQCPYVLVERGEYRWLNCQLREGHDGFCMSCYDKAGERPSENRRWRLLSDVHCPTCGKCADE